MKPTDSATGALCFFCLLFLLWGTTTGYASDVKVSGYVRDGFRILDIIEGSTDQSFTVYRGDYIKFNLPRSIEKPVLMLNDDGQETALIHDMDQAPYFKMRNTGEINFKINTVKGRILVIEYQAARYRAVTAAEAQTYIKTHSPLILDVRTPAEYRATRLEDAELIPVQELSRRIGELNAHKNSPVFIYCATGNRSTVASKILIDTGFKHIVNLRYGIVDWYKRNYPVKK